jgi:large subunit ribosomal protein L9
MISLGRTCGSRSFNILPWSYNQSRNFDWDPRITKRDGKPAFTGSKHAFVAAKIPVVLLRDIENLGVKGSIVEVKRGYARNNLVPRGDAVYGTIWENIDEYADPEVVTRRKVELAKQMSKQVLPFEWLNSVRLEILRSVKTPGSSHLSEPIDVWEVLNLISLQESVDLLPCQLMLDKGAIQTVGRHNVKIKLQLATGNHDYTLIVDVKDKAEVAAAERREAELKEAMKMKRPEFVLGAGRLSKAKAVGDIQDDIDEHRKAEEDDSDSDRA